MEPCRYKDARYNSFRFGGDGGKSLQLQQQRCGKSYIEVTAEIGGTR